MRLGIAAISLLASGCVVNPETLRGSLVPHGWLHVAPGISEAAIADLAQDDRVEYVEPDEYATAS